MSLMDGLLYVKKGLYKGVVWIIYLLLWILYMD